MRKAAPRCILHLPYCVSGLHIRNHATAAYATLHKDSKKSLSVVQRLLHRDLHYTSVTIGTLSLQYRTVTKESEPSLSSSWPEWSSSFLVFWRLYAAKYFCLNARSIQSPSTVIFQLKKVRSNLPASFVPRARRMSSLLFPTLSKPISFTASALSSSLSAAVATHALPGVPMSLVVSQSTFEA